jgi:macrolide-specific efflux system membrane fusion protein
VPADGSGEQGKQTFYNVLFEVDNPQQELMSGMSAQVRFVLAQAHDAVLLPLALLGKPEADDSYLVQVAATNQANQQSTPRRIKIGIRSEQMVQVLSGLEPGERVVVTAAAASTAATAPASASAATPKNTLPPLPPAASAPKAR